MEVGDICAICRDDEIEWDFVTRCGHYFHKDCLQAACFSRGNLICPYCRTKISASMKNEATLRKFFLQRKMAKDIAVTSVSELKDALQRRPDLFKDPQRFHDAFFIALNNNRSFMVNFLISLTPFVNYRDSAGRTILMTACWHGSLKYVRKLVESGADINAIDKSGNSVLVSACKNRKLDIVEYLLDKGADVYARNVDNLTVLHWACSCGYPEIVECLLTRGFDFKKLVKSRIGVYEAAYIGGNLKILEMLLKDGGADINETNNFNQNALFRIPRIDESTEFLRALINSGINVHLTDHLGRNALCNYVARCSHGAEAVVKVFLAAGVDVNQADNWGMRPSHYTCCNDRKFEIAQLLFEAGARFDVRNGDGEYPYDLALFCRRSDKIINFLETFDLAFSKDKPVESYTESCERCKRHHVGKECPEVKKITNVMRIKRIY